MKKNVELHDTSSVSQLHNESKVKVDFGVEGHSHHNQEQLEKPNEDTKIKTNKHFVLVILLSQVGGTLVIFVVSMWYFLSLSTVSLVPQQNCGSCDSCLPQNFLNSGLF